MHGQNHFKSLQTALVVVCVLRSRFTNFVAFEGTLVHLNFYVTAGEPRNLISITVTGKNISLL
jgi:hypothetical protein